MSPPIAFILWTVVINVGVCLYLYVRWTQNLPTLKAWCTLSGYTLVSYGMIPSFFFYQYGPFALPWDWAWKYSRVNVVEKSHEESKAVVYLGTKEVWVFWPDKGFSDRMSWEELLKSKGARTDEMLT